MDKVIAHLYAEFMPIKFLLVKVTNSDELRMVIPPLGMDDSSSRKINQCTYFCANNSEYSKSVVLENCTYSTQHKFSINQPCAFRLKKIDQY